MFNLCKIEPIGALNLLENKMRQLSRVYTGDGQSLTAFDRFFTVAISLQALTILTVLATASFLSRISCEPRLCKRD